MSVDEIEEQVRRLTAKDLGRFTRCFEQFLTEHVDSPQGDWRESADQIAELNKRLADFDSDPAIAKP